MKNPTLILGLASLLAVAGCGEPTGPGTPAPLTELPRDLSPAEAQVIQGSNRFAFDFLGALVEGREGENVFTSPLSASMAFGMAMNGADGNTWTQMRDVLGFGGLEEEAINASYLGLIALLRDLDPAVTFELGNSMWARDDLPVLPEFRSRLETWFDAEARTLDFGDPASVDVINDWVADATEGRIQDLLDEIPADMVLYLVNAIYFQGDWRSRFEEGRTAPGPFTTLDGATAQVDFMSTESGFRSVQEAGVSVVELPYGADAWSAVAVLPPPTADPVAFVRDLTPARWQGWMTALAGRPIQGDSGSAGRLVLRIPKLELEWKAELNQAMIDLGMTDAFSPMHANLGRITGTPNLYIMEALQKTFLKMDEKGTEAAAATSVGIGIVSMPPTISFDRPYVLAIRERLTGTILFLGLIGNPVE